MALESALTSSKHASWKALLKGIAATGKKK
jgi:hypothetical protein